MTPTSRSPWASTRIGVHGLRGARRSAVCRCDERHVTRVTLASAPLCQPLMSFGLCFVASHHDHEWSQPPMRTVPVAHSPSPSLLSHSHMAVLLCFLPW